MGLNRLLALAFLVVGLLPATASASQLIDRDASGVELEVSRTGWAMLTYRAHGETRHVLASGAINALGPTEGGAQVAFKVDYAGGWDTFGRQLWDGFQDSCRPYDGPPLTWLVAACRAADGSYWAVQSWQRSLPNYGLPPEPWQEAWELRLAHWRGPLPVPTVRFGWTYGRYQQLYGTLDYLGQPVYGFRSTAGGAPLDGFGRNVYVDTFDSAYGPGWQRENSFLSHKGTGAFCYGFYPHGDRPSGKGERYRITVIGPGVTPDVTWEAAAPPTYDAAQDASANQDMLSLLRGDRLCHPK